jgi:hypothetical protein
MKIRIRAFRSIDHIEASYKYAEGHKKVLEIYGVTQVTSANIDWIDNPSVIVIQAESISGDIVLGGARIHLTGQHPLPIEDAIHEFDPTIHDMVKKYAEQGTGELCGLWNAKEVAGYGIGTLFLMRAAISLTNQLKLNSLLAFCAQHTLEITTSKGFEIKYQLGKNGTFYYPKEDLVATAVIIKDPHILSKANPFERENILELRNNPLQTRKEESAKGELEIEYELLLSNVFKLA